jgi:hypothetical protein
MIWCWLKKNRYAKQWKVSDEDGTCHLSKQATSNAKNLTQLMIKKDYEEPGY